MAKMHPFEKFLANSKLDYLFHKFFAINKLLNEIDQPESMNILEIGCGVGITTGFIHKKFLYTHITAIDYDEFQLEKAKNRIANKNVHFLQGDATSLTFSDNTFDTCFAILVFHHIPEFPRTLQEIHRVLKKEAKFYIMDVPAKTLNPLHRWITFGQVGLFTKNEFIRALKHAGFRIKKVRGRLLFSVECEKV